jgi:hypothetical protein
MRARDGPGEKVDSLGDRLMYRLAYRNFGDHESLVATHSIEGGAFSGVRWYEIRNPGSSPVVFQQGTVVDPSVDYWMGSIAIPARSDNLSWSSATFSNMFFRQGSRRLTSGDLDSFARSIEVRSQTRQRCQ